MKNTVPRSTIIALVLISLNPAFTPAMRAEGQSREEAIAVLTSGMWHFEGANWSNDRIFDPKGTVLVRASNANGIIKWKIDAKQVTIKFSDHDDLMFLPIDPKGTKCMDQHGNDVVATLIPGSANTSAPARPPSALDALKPPGSKTGGPPPLSTADQLTTKKWKFDGASWSEIRTFNADGTMTIQDNPNVAHWQVTSAKIIMTFPDHKDVLFLPLDPKGTKGEDSHGRLVIATEATPADLGTGLPGDAPTTATPPPGGSFFGKSTDGLPSDTSAPSPSPAK